MHNLLYLASDLEMYYIINRISLPECECPLEDACEHLEVYITDY